MRRVSGIATVALAALLASCGGSSSPTTQAGDVATPAATNAATGDTGNNTEPTEAPAAGNAAPVKIADANYSSGMAHVEITGGQKLTFDGQLVIGVSFTNTGTTVITYQGGAGNDTVAFAISSNPDTPDAGLTFSLSTTTWVTGGDRTSGCVIDLTRNDASGLEGQFTCRGMQAIAGSGVSTVDVTATFSAAK